MIESVSSRQNLPLLPIYGVITYEINSEFEDI